MPITVLPPKSQSLPNRHLPLCNIFWFQHLSNRNLVAEQKPISNQVSIDHFLLKWKFGIIVDLSVLQPQNSSEEEKYNGGHRTSLNQDQIGVRYRQIIGQQNSLPNRNFPPKSQHFRFSTCAFWEVRLYCYIFQFYFSWISWKYDSLGYKSASTARKNLMR